MRTLADAKPWFREDLARVLVSINEAARGTHRNGRGTSDEYRDGFYDALRCVALSVGIDPEIFAREFLE